MQNHAEPTITSDPFADPPKNDPTQRRRSSIRSLADKEKLGLVSVQEVEVSNDSVPSSRRSSVVLPLREIGAAKKPGHRRPWNLTDEQKERYARRALRCGNFVQNSITNTSVVGAGVGMVCGVPALELGMAIGGVAVGSATYAATSVVGLLAGGPIAAVTGKRYLDKHGKARERYDWPITKDTDREKRLRNRGKWVVQDA
jgi:hypothetical protein